MPLRSGRKQGDNCRSDTENNFLGQDSRQLTGTHRPRPLEMLQNSGWKMPPRLGHPQHLCSTSSGDRLSLLESSLYHLAARTVDKFLKFSGPQSPEKWKHDEDS